MKGRRGRWIGGIVAVLVVGVLAIVSVANGAHGAVPGTGGSGSSSPGATSSTPVLNTSTVLDFLWKFGIVVALLGGSLWLLRRYAGANRRSRGRTGAINVVDTIALAQGRAIYVLDLGDRALVVGATQQQITPLADVTDTEILARLRAESASAPLAIPGLAKRLNPKLRLEEARLAARTAGETVATPAPRTQGPTRAAAPPTVPEPTTPPSPASESPTAPALESPAPEPASPPALSASRSADFAAALAAYVDTGSLAGQPRPPTAPLAPARPVLTASARSPEAGVALRALAERLKARRQSA